MRKFIKLTLSYSIAFIVFYLALIGMSEYIIKKNANFKLEGNPKSIILGHSHSECAFNDSLIDGFKNMSKSGEPYFYTYLKTKEILKQNPSIKVIFIEFANNHITKQVDNWTWGEPFLSEWYPIYAPFMSVSDKSFLARKNSKYFLNVLSLSSKLNWERVFEKNYNYSDTTGGYLYLIRDKTDSLVQKHKEFSYLHKNNRSYISKNSISDLMKIIKYCELQGKQVILIRSPLHDFYPDYYNEKEYQRVRKKYFPKQVYLDFSKFPLENSEFGDFEHLNFKGAEVFSEWFASILKEGLLSKKDMQKFIELKEKEWYHNRLENH